MEKVKITRKKRNSELYTQEFIVGVKHSENPSEKYRFIPFLRHNPYSFISLFYGDYHKLLIEKNFQNILKNQEEKQRKKTKSRLFIEKLTIPDSKIGKTCGICRVTFCKYLDHVKSEDHLENLKNDTLYDYLVKLAKNFKKSKYM